MRVKLGDVCSRGSSNLKQSDVIDKSGDYPIYGAAGYIGNVDFYHQDKKYVAVVKDGAGIGRTVLLPPKSSVIGTMQYLLPNEKVLPEYLYYVVSYMHLEKYFSGATIPHIYFRDYQHEEFNLASVVEQVRIVSTLDKLQSIITHRKQQLTKLDELVKARFVEIFGGDFSKYDTMPLKDCCAEITGGSTPSMKHPEYYGGAIPFIKSGDVKEDRVSQGALTLTDIALKETTAKLLPKDIIVVVVRSAALLHEFHIAIADNPIVINQDLKAIKPTDLFIPIYLMWAIKMKEHVILGKVQTMLTSHIRMDDFLYLDIPVPPLALQHQFSEFVVQVDKSKVAVQKALDEAQLLFDSLMQEYFG